MTIRVLVADDQTLVRQGICSLLSLDDQITVVGEATNGVEVLKALDLYNPEVLLLDIRMPIMNGIETLKQIAQQRILMPTIILTTFDDDELVLEGIQCGAKGFLLKDVSLENLVDAIICVHKGGSYLLPVITQNLLKGLSGLKHNFDSFPEPESLTIRETEIVRLMAGGYSNREIAVCTHKSEGTVKNQVSSILGKLGVRDRTRAVLRAIDLGLLN